MDALSTDLSIFLKYFFKEYKFKKVRFDELHLDTNIEVDLDIFDLDADALLSEFCIYFKVDYSSFSWKKYGYPNGLTTVYLLRKFFGKREWIDRFAEKQRHTAFTLRALENAIISKKLV